MTIEHFLVLGCAKSDVSILNKPMNTSGATLRFSVLGAVYTEIRKIPRHVVLSPLCDFTAKLQE